LRVRAPESQSIRNRTDRFRKRAVDAYLCTPAVRPDPLAPIVAAAYRNGRAGPAPSLVTPPGGSP